MSVLLINMTAHSKRARQGNARQGNIIHPRKTLFKEKLTTSRWDLNHNTHILGNTLLLSSRQLRWLGQITYTRSWPSI